MVVANYLAKALGNSIQKLEYLPEAHNDFIMAIVAEEFGFVGVSVCATNKFSARC